MDRIGTFPAPRGRDSLAQSAALGNELVPRLRLGTDCCEPLPRESSRCCSRLIREAEPRRSARSQAEPGNEGDVGLIVNWFVSVPTAAKRLALAMSSL